MASLRFPAINDLIADAAEREGRGAKVGLARHCGVKPTSSGRWINREMTPDRRYWADIESYFDLPEGVLAAAAGFTSPPPGSYQERIADLEARVASLETSMARLTGVEYPLDVSVAAASDHGDRHTPNPAQEGVHPSDEND